MTRFVWRSLVARRRRAVLTAVAVFVGVAMISGTFVFTDTINAAFRQLFTSAATGADVIVASRQDISSPLTAPASIPSSLTRRIGALPGVAAAYGQVQDSATIVGRNGKALTSLGSPTLALSYVPPPFNGLTFVAGARPRGTHQVAIDEGTAITQHYRIGDLVPIVTAQPVRRFQISGIVRYGSASLGGARFAVFDLGTARSLYGKAGRVDLIYVAASKGTSPSAVVHEIRPLLGPELIARTAQGEVNTDLQRVSSQLSILTGGLLAFGFIAVFVGAFVIFNTFSITVAQRAGEFALLRALGAVRGQVLGAVLAEAGAIGLVSSVAGLAGGVGAAAVIRALFSGAGLNLPSAGLVLSGRTVLVGLAVGVLVTVAAGALPAWRATRTAPLEALRDAEAPRRPRTGRRRVAGLLPVAVLAAGGLALVFTSSGSINSRLTASAVGAVMLVLAIVALVPALVSRLARILASPFERGRVLPRLARDNAARNPGRTAVSASGLMIGLALVLFVTVYAHGLRASTNEIIDHTLLGDFTIESQNGTSLIPAASARAAAITPGVVAASSLKEAVARVGPSGPLTAIGLDPATFGDVYRFDWINGSASTLTNLAAGQVIVERDTASAANLHVGEHTTLKTETGLRAPVTIAGIYKDQALLRGVALPLSQFDPLFHQSQLAAVFVKLGPDADRAAAGAALRQSLAAFPGVVARSQKQLRDQVAGRVNSILVLFYALLAMSVLMALLGIINTLTLSIHERTRELGMLRAVGMTRGQARGLIRDESLLTAAVGTLVGIALGLVLAWVVTRALSNEGIVFSVPWAQVGLVLVVGPLAGALAAIAPAARAARLDVLAAIAHE
ncbi:MAG TPA: FtsX-like permease family protein [Solirubrobacteraceae bacterium]|nr:FtsX-like permease family protein [Solirubrobacteraceae bacterium]